MSPASLEDRAESGSSEPVRKLGWYGASLLFLMLGLLAVALQWLSGAYEGEFNGYPDEPAHYVTGLMIRDYIAAGIPQAPMEFARNYYLHYPKVALGQWPPLFYVAEAAWMLLFPVTIPSMMVFMACLAASFSSVLYAVSRSASIGVRLSIGIAVVLLTLPSVTYLFSMVMGDVLGALLCLAAAASFAAY